MQSVLKLYLHPSQSVRLAWKSTDFYQNFQETSVHCLGTMAVQMFPGLFIRGKEALSAEKGHKHSSERRFDVNFNRTNNNLVHKTPSRHLLNLEYIIW